MTSDEDVPSPIDLRDLAQARAWEAQTVQNRPWRPQFFEAFAAALTQRFPDPFTVLELGSGPGHLAQHLLKLEAISRYSLLDFSPAMHQIARERLGAFENRADYLTRDFSKEDWNSGIGPFDAVVMLQAAHETRHKRHLPLLLHRARAVIAPGGLLLFCDHYAGPGKHPDLYLEAEEQASALEQAGFSKVIPLLDMGGMALFSARN